jgi:hypothetical protein
MAENTAKYDSEYICQRIPEETGPLNYIGYNMEEWIKLKLHRPGYRAFQRRIDSNDS